MGDCNGSSTAGGRSGLSVLAGAVIGAAGLAWWLLAEAERRRQHGQQARATGISVSPAASGKKRDLHDRVHELNQAIDDVRRQLESMAIKD
jgi:HAMP domain-containing protein